MTAGWALSVHSTSSTRRYHWLKWAYFTTIQQVDLYIAWLVQSHRILHLGHYASPVQRYFHTQQKSYCLYYRSVHPSRNTLCIGILLSRRTCCIYKYDCCTTRRAAVLRGTMNNMIRTISTLSLSTFPTPVHVCMPKASTFSTLLLLSNVRKLAQ